MSEIGLSFCIITWPWTAGEIPQRLEGWWHPSQYLSSGKPNTLLQIYASISSTLYGAWHFSWRPLAVKSLCGLLNIVSAHSLHAGRRIVPGRVAGSELLSSIPAAKHVTGPYRPTAHVRTHVRTCP